MATLAFAPWPKVLVTLLNATSSGKPTWATGAVGGLVSDILLSGPWDKQHRTQTHPHPGPLPPAATARQRGESVGRGGRFADRAVNPGISSRILPLLIS